jgi:hypothetical protein
VVATVVKEGKEEKGVSAEKPKASLPVRAWEMIKKECVYFFSARVSRTKTASPILLALEQLNVAIDLPYLQSFPLLARDKTPRQRNSHFDSSHVEAPSGQDLDSPRASSGAFLGGNFFFFPFSLTTTMAGSSSALPKIFCVSSPSPSLLSSLLWKSCYPSPSSFSPTCSRRRLLTSTRRYVIPLATIHVVALNMWDFRRRRSESSSKCDWRWPNSFKRRSGKAGYKAPTK